MRKLLLLTAILTAYAAAQDAVQVDSKHFKLEYEDAKIRLVREVLPPGESTVKHAHGERTTVCIRGGKLRMVDASGKITEIEVKSGEATHLPAQVHTVSNIGTTVFEEVSTEFKGTELQSYAEQLEAPAAKPRVESARPMIQATQSGNESKPDITAPPAIRTNESVASQLEERVTPVSPIKGAKSGIVNGASLTYIDVGQGEPLVLVHDIAADLRNWAQQIDEFAKHYRVIAYSRRYHYPNAGTGKEDDYTYQQNASDLLTLIAQLNLGKVRAIGHGYGAAVVAAAAMQKPEAFRSVVLMEPPFESLLPERQADAARYSRAVMMGMVRKEALKRQNKEGAAHSFVDWSHSPGTWDSLSGDAKQRYVENVNALAAYSAHPEPPAFDCDDGKKMTMPALIVQGAASGPNYRIMASTLAECVPNAKKVNIQDATHWMHRENPAGFNQAVLEFLGRN